MIARRLYAPRHARPRRGRYRAGPRSSAGLYAACATAVVAALTWPIPAVIA